MSNNIYKKLKLASADARMVKKTEKKGGMNFNPLEHDAVQAVAMEALIKNDLYPYCTYKDFTIEDDFVRTTCKMTIVDLDDPSSSIEIETHALAKKDKYGSGNCMSYARKYAFLNALNLRTGMKDDELEAKDVEDGYNAIPFATQLSKTVSKEPKIDNIYIATQLDVIQQNKDNKNSTVLKSELENLKTRISKAGIWDAFFKSNNFKTFNALRIKHNNKRS
jgi:hypothetical protein